MNYEQKREIAEQNLEPWFQEVYAELPHPDETFISESAHDFLRLSDFEDAKNLIFDMVPHVGRFRSTVDEEMEKDFSKRAQDFFWHMAHAILAGSMHHCQEKGMFEQRTDWDELMADQALKNIKEDAA